MLKYGTILLMGFNIFDSEYQEEVEDNKVTEVEIFIGERFKNIFVTSLLVLAAACSISLYNILGIYWLLNVILSIIYGCVVSLTVNLIYAYCSLMMIPDEYRDINVS